LKRDIERLNYYGETYSNNSSLETEEEGKRQRKRKCGKRGRREGRGAEFRGPVGDVAPNPLMRRKDDDSNAGSSVDRKVGAEGDNVFARKNTTRNGKGKRVR
jgi:hypothetical protein